MGSSGSDVDLDSSDGGDDEPPPSVDIPSSADEDEYEPPSDEDDDTVSSADDAESTAGDDPELESRLRDFLGAMPASRVASAAEDFVRTAFEDSPSPLEVQFRRRQAERAAGLRGSKISKIVVHRTTATPSRRRPPPMIDIHPLMVKFNGTKQCKSLDTGKSGPCPPP